MSYKTLRKKLFRDIFSRKAQFLILCVTVIVGILTYSSLTMATYNLENSYEYAYKELKYADFTIYLEAAPQSILKQIEEITNVKNVEGRLSIEAGIEVSEDRQISGLIIGINSSRKPRVNDIVILDGEYFHDGDKNACILEQHIAKAYGYKAGDQFTLIINGSKINLLIRGIAASAEFLITFSEVFQISSGYTYGVVFVPLDFLQSRLGLFNIINEICVTVQDKSLIEQTINEVESVLKSYNVIKIVKGEDQPGYKALKWDIEGFYEIAEMFTMLILLVAAMEIYIMLKRLIISQRKEIGILKAMGYKRKQIIFHYLSYAILIGLIGSTIGVLISIKFSQVTTYYYTSVLGIPFHLTKIYPEVLITSFLIGELSCIIGAILPCLETLKMYPSEIMKPYLSTLMIKGRVPLIEKILQKFFKLSTFSKISIRNLFRNNVRTLSTILGISLSLMLIVSMFGVMDSFYNTIEVGYKDYEKWDIRVRFSTWKATNEVLQIKEWEGIIKVEPFIVTEASIEYGNEVLDCLIIGIPQNSTLRGLKIVKGSEFQSGGIFVTKDIVKKLNLDIGKNITIKIFNRNISIKLFGICEELFYARTCFLTINTAQKILGIGESVNGAYIKSETGKLSNIRKKLYNLPNVERVDVKEESRKEWLDVMREFTVFPYVMLIMGLLIAFSVTFNTLTINVIERNYEHATLLTMGIPIKKITRALFIETILMIIPAIILGMGLGFMVSYYFLEVFTEQLTEEFIVLKPYINPLNITQTIIFLIAVIIITHYISKKQIRKINLSKLIKEAVV